MYLDLNLLTALDALLAEGSVSGAAARLHLSQPAMSRTLARIRAVSGDPILVRAGRAMIPSARAEAMRAEVAELVRRTRAVLSVDAELRPAELDRTFSLRCHDALLPSLGSPLISALQRHAPRVSLRLLAEAEGDERRTPVDLEIGAQPAARGLRSVEVARDQLAVALRRAHPCARGKLTPKRFAAALHVTISRRGRLRDPLDDVLAAQGLQRRVVVSAPTTAAALSYVKEAELLTVVAARACAPLAQTLGLVLRPLPLETAPVAIVQSWPDHLDGDPAHHWLRELTRDILTRLVR